MSLPSVKRFLTKASLSAIVVLFAISSFSAPKRLEFTSCRLGEIVRTLEMFEEAESFYLIYTKGRDREEAARGTHRSFVRGIMENIQGNLGDAGWKCEPVSADKVIETNVGS